jgi:hypothetical protein
VRFSRRRNNDLQLPDRNLALALVVLVLLCIPRQLLGQTFTFTTFDAPAGVFRQPSGLLKSTSVVGERAPFRSLRQEKSHYGCR